MLIFCSRMLMEGCMLASSSAILNKIAGGKKGGGGERDEEAGNEGKEREKTGEGRGKSWQDLWRH